MLLNFAAVLVLAPLVVVAEPITIGSLSSNDDGTTEVISDSLNGLEWLRWDEIAGFSFAETESFAEDQGWSIAGVNEAQLFVNAVIPDPTCTVSEITGNDQVDCGTLPDSFFNLAGDNAAFNSTQAWILNADGGVGSLSFVQAIFGTGILRAQRNFTTISGSDSFEFTWLLYREAATSEPDEPTASVPEPGTLALLGAGLVGMGFARRRKRV